MPVDWQLRVVAYRPGGEWLCEAVVPGKSPGQLAEELLGKIPLLQADLSADAPHFGVVEPVTFLVNGDVTLIFTAAGPISAVLASGPSPSTDWIQLAPWVAAGESLAEADPVRTHLLDHWRQAVEESTAAFDLLPQYFTTSQARAVYASLWGSHQDPGNFHRWLHQRNAGVCEKVEAETVRYYVEDAMARAARWQAMGDTLGAMNTAAWDRGTMVGVSPMALGTLARVVPKLGLVAGMVGAAVAFQERNARGTVPTWFTRTTPERRVLSELYAPRPAWLLPGQSPPSQPASRPPQAPKRWRAKPRNPHGTTPS